jgi:Caspase domain
MITRAAVVIGIDKPQDLPPLRAAASGANKIGDWLESEGFEVKRFTDETKSVTAEEIFDAINGLVKLGTLKQLVVYFAGHGCIVGAGEFWLLTKALQNPNEAVSVNVCLDRSRLCGIPNVVLISDACRSTSASLGIQELNGYVIFPTTNNRNIFTYLDRFLAVRTGAPAYEVKDTANEYQGIYTSCILDAYSDPDDSMIEEINDASVVTNKRLEDYLLSEVPKRAQLSNALQYPDSSVTSKDSYIGRARISGRPPGGGWRGCGGCRGCRGCLACGGCAADSPSVRSKPKVGRIPPTINDLSEFELGRLGLEIRTTASKKSSPTDLQKIAQETGFAALRHSILNARGPNVFKYGTGINVFGARLQTVASVNMETQVLRQGDGLNEPAVIQIDPRGKLQDSVALEFSDGSGAVIAALQRLFSKCFCGRRDCCKRQLCTGANWRRATNLTIEQPARRRTSGPHCHVHKVRRLSDRWSARDQPQQREAACQRNSSAKAY